MDVSEFQGYWRNRIERDLAPFADPGTVLTVTSSGAKVSASWISRGDSLEATFFIAIDGVSVLFNQTRLSYRSFLSSEQMSDLRGLARMILQTKKETPFVQTRGRLTDDNSPHVSRPVLEILSDQLGLIESEGQTRVVFVTGDAGVGKTHVLQRLVSEQATKYISGQTDRLYLYVNAQGRALSKFNEALAIELQDLRSRVTYHSVGSLVRAGVVVPVVDGFDELIGAAGYEDAFSSLSAFIEELDGYGQIVASARSAYYQLEFVARANTESSLGKQAWMLVPVLIEGWGEGEFDVYLRESLSVGSLSQDEKQGIRKRVERMLSGGNSVLREKPFFVTEAMRFAREGFDVDEDADLLEQFVVAYAKREKPKLGGGADRPVLDETQIIELMTTIAEEMWNQETRELDKRTLRDITEIATSGIHATQSDLDIVITKVPSVAPLSAAGRRNHVSFEHEMYFGFFLGKAFERSLRGESSVLRMLLARSPLPKEVADRAARDPGASSKAVVAAILKLSGCASVEDRRSSQVRENAGVLAAALLRASARSAMTIEEATLRWMTFPGVSFDSVRLARCTLENLDFYRADLSRAKFEHCRGDSLLFRDVLVDESVTRLEIVGADLGATVFSIRRRTENGEEAIYDPSRIVEVLSACGAIAEVADERSVDPAIQDLVERLAKAYARANPISPDDATMRALFSDPDWPTLERVLLQSELITEETRPTRGSRKRFFRRRFLPDQLVAGMNRRAKVPSQISHFWSQLERDFPAAGE